MLNDKKKLLIYNLCVGLSKLYTNIQQDQKAKLDDHMSRLFAYMYMAGGEGVWLEVLKCFVGGGQNFFYKQMTNKRLQINKKGASKLQHI